jgi:uncharacterized cupin superfamily protein
LTRRAKHRHNVIIPPTRSDHAPDVADPAHATDPVRGQCSDFGENSCMPKIDLAVPGRKGSGYPAPFAGPCADRIRKRLGNAGGLSDFGVNLMQLPPGNWSSQRHWHSHEDEFVYVLAGELTLVTDDGEEMLRAGDSVGFRAGVQNGHCLQNRSKEVAEFLVVGSRSDEDHGEYPDIDLIFKPGRYSGGGGYAHKDGTPY